VVKNKHSLTFKSTMPAVSVIVPCYNAGKYVQQSVESILRQSWEDLELIIVDDASRDNSVEVIKELAGRDARIKLLVHDRNCGVSRSRNDGLRAAQGDFIAFCDADDVWKPEKLKSQIEFLANNPAYDVAYCDAQIIDATGALTGRLFSGQFPPPLNPSGDLFEELCTRNFINMQTVCLRRDAAGQAVFFDEGIRWVEDWWQWIRLSRSHRFVYDRRPLAQYRVHEQSTGFTQKRGISKNRWKVCKRNLRTHADMSRRLQALLWYYMGTELSLLGRRRLARKFLWRAICLGLDGTSSIKRLMAMIVRWGMECCHGFTLKNQ
jgi:glycosyltransferase involved in cell wall biosynthesis